MNISFCITVADEETEFFKLLNHLKPFLREGDEILVKVDNTKVTEGIKRHMIDSHEVKGKSTVNKWYIDDFKGNFSEWKNELIPNCKNPIILFLDADELPNPQLLEDLPLIMELNECVDIIGVPRINFVEGITEDYIKQMRWSVSQLENYIDEKIIDLNNPTDLEEYNMLKKYNLIIEENY